MSRCVSDREGSGDGGGVGGVASVVAVEEDLVEVCMISQGQEVE